MKFLSQVNKQARNNATAQALSEAASVGVGALVQPFKRKYLFKPSSPTHHRLIAARGPSSYDSIIHVVK